MTQSIDLDNLRAITDGDKQLEAELFKDFLSSSIECLAGMDLALANEDESLWKSQSHALKGLCFNLGAGPLGELAKQAQNDFRGDPEDKAKLLGQIRAEFAVVTDIVQKILGGA